jgi:hypothetical protein
MPPHLPFVIKFALIDLQYVGPFLIFLLRLSFIRVCFHVEVFESFFDFPQLLFLLLVLVLLFVLAFAFLLFLLFLLLGLLLLVIILFFWLF